MTTHIFFNCCRYAWEIWVTSAKFRSIVLYRPTRASKSNANGIGLSFEASELCYSTRECQKPSSNRNPINLMNETFSFFFGGIPWERFSALIFHDCNSRFEKRIRILGRKLGDVGNPDNLSLGAVPQRQTTVESCANVAANL
ncbi:predicted protein [Sclerotinia sclerotiorum 1980 UF-70]|uniref:Uncharacterized protein n=1 Tax=Sclerotinia sclerotiorum (strain ATCC 18683 / 1980 / Ss-1) TaxID=665079 RepID=A7F599_SCLS1|nr:predicted protein [Sclerotinia sclerotiorum 1980 UF-70]EDN97920.1 predicted protein [Sclerotinia sclerotiorum 1980 UF-70]